MGRKKGQSYVDMPPPIDELNLSTVDRLDRLQRELRAATLNLQRLGRELGFRCDSHEQVEATASEIERCAHGSLRQALHCYQGTRLRMITEVRRSEVPSEVPTVTRCPRTAPATKARR